MENLCSLIKYVCRAVENRTFCFSLHIYVGTMILAQLVFDGLTAFFLAIRASLGTPFSKRIPIFSRDNKLISLGNMEIL